jgi:hypothetical protein
VAADLAQLMTADSAFQSSLLSWIMQRESIHIYRRPQRVVMVNASWDVVDRFSRGILFLNFWKF